MNVLLTGGSGYIGSHTAVELIGTGHDVIIADNFSNSSQKVIQRLEMLTGKNIRYFHVDVSDKSALEPIFSSNSVDAVIHFAGFKSVAESVKLPLIYYKNNIECTLVLLELMEKYHVKSFIFSSSATVYGTPKFLPINEDASSGHCANPYGRTKFFNEQIIKDFALTQSDFSAVILRYFNPVGAHPSGEIGEVPNGVPNNLMPYITQVASGKLEMLSIFGNDYPTKDGTGVRDYIHVVDLAKGHIAALNFSVNNTGIDIFNLGTGTGLSVLEILHTFEKVNNIKIPYTFAARRDGDIPEIYADANKANSILGWNAMYTVDDMCKHSWNWQVKNPYGYV
jgi:UDP-glucose 4-epimerase